MVEAPLDGPLVSALARQEFDNSYPVSHTSLRIQEGDQAVDVGQFLENRLVHTVQCPRGSNAASRPNADTPAP